MDKNGRFAAKTNGRTAASRTGHPGITFLMDPSPSVILPPAGSRKMQSYRRSGQTRKKDGT